MRIPKVLIACEESQRVCIAMREIGIEAYSCDILPCSGGHPEWHIQADVIPLLNGYCTFYTKDGKRHYVNMAWDMIIAFPPCTDLASSGARWFKEKIANGQQQRSIAFFKVFTVTNCKRVAIENPIGIMSTHYRKPDQIIQPYWFGDHARKSTCLWLKNLPKLNKTNVVDPGVILDGGYSCGASANYAKDENGKILAWNDPRTARIRSKTFPGIAKAMADQWGRLLLKEAET